MFQVGKLHHLKVLDLSNNHIVSIEGLKVKLRIKTHFKIGLQTYILTFLHSNNSAQWNTLKLAKCPAASQAL